MFPAANAVSVVAAVFPDIADSSSSISVLLSISIILYVVEGDFSWSMRVSAIDGIQAIRGWPGSAYGPEQGASGRFWGILFLKVRSGMSRSVFFSWSPTELISPKDWGWSLRP